MALGYVGLILQRVVIPTVLILSALYRPVGISFVYLLMFFISPFIPIANTQNFRGSVTAYFIILIALSTILLLCHITLQLTILALNISTVFGTCSFTEQLLRHVGFVDFHNLKPLAVAEWLLPEVAVFVTSLAVYIITKKVLVKPASPQNEDGDLEVPQRLSDESAATIISNVVVSGPNFDGLIKISPLFCLASIFVAAVLRPSVPGGFYFLIFLLSGSYWAMFKKLKRGFIVLLRIIMVVIVGQAVCFVAYQTPWMQNHVDSDSLPARLIGLEPLVISTCANDIRIIQYNTSYKFDSFLNPAMMLFTYFVLALTTKNLKAYVKPPKDSNELQENGSKFNRQVSLMTQTTRSSKKDSWTRAQRLNVSLRREQRPKTTVEPTETTPLVRHNTNRSKREVSSPDDISLQNQNAENDYDETANTICDQICYGFISIGGFIYQNSYIFTNILMMTWAIVYHSWLTFVLLLWANILWMIPNQRKAMMRSSPFIVIYAELLIIAQYIYGINLKNDELPSKVDTAGINLAQIGLERPQENDTQPCVPLIVKTAFLLMFWVTSRQFFKEKKRPLTSVYDMSVPLHLATSENDFTDHTGKKTSKFLKKAGDVIKYLLVRLWIWMLVLVIFLCAVSGEHITGFRICYMALFLFFLLVFQSSSFAWMKVMYGFWLFLIFYAMSILILIYTYQFDKFDQYWYDYLNISATLQKDIGLEQFKTKDLFLHLLSPTIIVILTVIQVHYFHRRFIASMQQPLIPVQLVISAEDVPKLKEMPSHRKLSISPSHYDQQASSVTQDAKKLLRSSVKHVRHVIRHYFKILKHLFWRFLELHIIKAVYITAFVCCVSEICLLHVIFVGLCIIGIISRTSIQVFVSRIISFVVSIIILAKMIYQVNYLHHEDYEIHCKQSNLTGNNAYWFGLEKASEETGGLIGLLKKYIIYMVMVTLHAVVTLRQYQMRTSLGTQYVPAAKVLFPKVTRNNAEANLTFMVKYLFNYAFYKFGLEITFIGLVSTITYRQDVVAVLYSVWLAVLLVCNRSTCDHIWGIFQLFVTLSIFIQYIMLVSLPPSLCLVYPWIGSRFSTSLQAWTMLPGEEKMDHSVKLIFDYILLILINRQKRVFHIETQHKEKDDYEGGSNNDVVNDIANLGKVPFVNPTHDFLSHVRNYLDVSMYAVLCGFYWLTLAVVFLAGTNISDVIALGYLIGAFIFLWEGSDFYLRPINTIINRWRWLLVFNVVSIVAKTCMEMAGCLFIEELTEHSCWLVHLLGITCAYKQTVINNREVITSGECPALTRNTILIWDAICFAFLIFQLRIFKSHFFCHIIIDTKANSILATRGADIIEDLRRKQIEHRQEHENEVLRKIKRKMERIRATQQKMLKPIDKPSHFDEEGEANVKPIVIAIAPLAHNSSFSSCQGSGYHTPDEDDDQVSTSDVCTTTRSETDNDTDSESNDDRAQLIDNADREQLQQKAHDNADILSQSDATENALAEPFTRLNLPEIDIQANTQQNTPSSDRTTLPLDGFLDVNRISLGSAPNSDLVVPLPEDGSEESYEVFSPPPYESIQQTLLPTLLLPVPHTSCSLSVNVSGASSLISSNLGTSAAATGRHRRQSSVNAVSWNETVSVKCASDEITDKGDDSERVAVTLRQKSLHRRHLSMGNATYPMDEESTLQEANRRYSNVSWARDRINQHAKARPHSWGPVEHGNPVSGTRGIKRKDLRLHAQAVRAGDYYMFDDIDDKFELDMIEDERDYLEDQDKSEQKLQRRKTVINVWKDIQGAEVRRQLYMRQRSYASAPGSRIGIKIDEELDETAEGGVRTSTLSEPPDYVVHRSTSDSFTEQVRMKVPEKTTEGKPSTSKEALSEGTSEQKIKTDEDTVDKTEEESDDDVRKNPIVRLLEGFLVSMTIGLHRFSRNYRYVNKILSSEKNALKDSKNIHRLLRPGAAAIFTTLRKRVESNGELEDRSQLASSTSNNAQDYTNNTQPSQNNSNENTTTTSPSANLEIQTQIPPATSPTSHEQPQQSHVPHIADATELSLDTVDVSPIRGVPPEGSQISAKGHVSVGLPEIRIKAPSFDCSHNHTGFLSKQWSYDKMESATEILEDDFATREHHIIVEFLMSAWFALLSNTDVICYLVVFINQVVNASVISLPLPLMVFLWGTLSLPRPTKTFWVTLIAYTQAIVLIKCIFQYKLIWANYVNLPNQPLAPAKIFGVELDPNYASYDLLLLLVLFSHRFILKQHGLWKSEYKDTLLQQIGSKPGKKKKEMKEADEASVAGEPGEAGKQEKKKKVTIYNDIVSRDDREEGGADKDDIQPKTENDNENNFENLERISQLSVGAVLVEQDSQYRTGSKGSIAPGVYTRNMKRLRRARYLSSVVKFFKNLVHKSRLPSDVYALMFLCDFVNFFVLLFGYTAFGSQQSEGEGNGGVQTYLEENKVPIPFLIMLLVQFLLIVIDRALYLRKALVNKIIFHFLSVIGIHIWMFFVIPLVTERSFYSLLPPIIFYINKCFYLLLSSYQIMCGYPKRILGNFLTKGFSLIHMISFKVYMIVPFLYELRTILDWVCINSTMTLFDWLKMEDIFSDIYFIKCSRQMENDFPAIRAKKKPIFTKLILGGLFILMIVVAIWGPLCIFALANAVGQSNIPKEVSVSIRIGSFDPIYQMNTRDHIKQFDDSMYSDMRNVYIKDKSAVTFLTGYDPSDIAAVKLPGNSPSLWNISPPDKKRLLQELRDSNPIVVSFSYRITRTPPDKSLVGTVSTEIVYTMNDTFPGRQAMVDMLEGKPGSTVIIPDILPKFMKVLNSGDAVVVQQLSQSEMHYRPLGIIMHTGAEESRIWWEINDFCKDDFHKTHLSKLPMVNCKSGIVLYTFNDKKFPSTFSWITKGGILGMYTTFVIVASRFFKSFIGGQNRRIMFEDMPYVDRVLQLCLDIYLVREALEFALEEDLFAKLIFLYRSPETMIKWTRPKEETNDDETDTESVRSRISGRRGEQPTQSQS